MLRREERPFAREAGGQAQFVVRVLRTGKIFRIGGAAVSESKSVCPMCFQFVRARGRMAAKVRMSLSKLEITHGRDDVAGSRAAERAMR